MMRQDTSLPGMLSYVTIQTIALSSLRKFLRSTRRRGLVFGMAAYLHTRWNPSWSTPSLAGRFFLPYFVEESTSSVQDVLVCTIGDSIYMLYLE
jgi:hypothetical protein